MEIADAGWNLVQHLHRDFRDVNAWGRFGRIYFRRSDRDGYLIAAGPFVASTLIDAHGEAASAYSRHLPLRSNQKGLRRFSASDAADHRAPARIHYRHGAEQIFPTARQSLGAICFRLGVLQTAACRD